MKYFLYLLLLVLSFSVTAEDIHFTGHVKIVRSHDLHFGEDVDWIGIEGFATAGDCKVDEGLVVIPSINPVSNRSLIISVSAVSRKIFIVLRCSIQCKV